MATTSTPTQQGIADFQALKRQADDLRAEAQRAQGALASEMAKIRETYGVETIEEAEEKLVALQAAETEAVTAAEQALEAFNATWGEQLKKQV